MKQLWKKPIMDHIVWYKENVLQCREKGQWDGQPYRHIFPPDKTDLNFIERKAPTDRNLKNTVFPMGEEKIRRVIGYDHMNSHWVIGLNLFPKLFASPWAEQSMLSSLTAQGLQFLEGRSISRAWFEEPLGGDQMADVCLELDDETKILISLYYYQFSFGEEKNLMMQHAEGKTHSVFVLLRQNTGLDPDLLLETEISERENAANLHVVYWEQWIPCLISLLQGNDKEYCKELYRKNFDFN